MKTIQKLAVASLVAGMATAAGNASADPVAYLIVEGIVGGDSKVLPGTIDLMSVDFNATATINGETGLASGKRQYSPIVIQKQVDGSSTGLLRIFNDGTATGATIQFVNFGTSGALPPYLKIELTNALISSYSFSTAGGVPTESISFNYSQIKETYTPPAGTGGGGGSVTYNLGTGGP